MNSGNLSEWHLRTEIVRKRPVWWRMSGVDIGRNGVAPAHHHLDSDPTEGTGVTSSAVAIAAISEFVRRGIVS